MMSRNRAIALLCGLVVAGGCGPGGHERGYASDSDGVRICPAGSTVPGIDVSHWDGPVDWGQVAGAGYKFAIAKATEGTGTVDGTFATNWAGIKAAGLVRGAYHFFHVTQDGVAQANAFLAMVGTIGQAGDLPPVLDWEAGSGTCDATAVQQAKAFLDRVEQQTGVVPMIYTAAGYWSGCPSTSQFARYPLWVANYVALSTCPSTPATWSRWNIWQYSETGRVAGIDPNTDVDLNIFNGTLADLLAFAGGGTPTQTASLAQSSGNEAITMVNWTDGRASLFGVSPSGTELVLTTTGANDTWSASESVDTGAACGSAAAFWGGSWNYPELFSPLSNGTSGHLWWTSSSVWRPYQAFGGSNLAHFSTAVGKDGRANVFALGTDGAIYTNTWNTTAAAWSGWTSLGGNFVTGASAITWGNGTIELFATTAAGTVRHSWLLSNTITWAAWADIGGNGIASRPVAVRWIDGSAGHAEIFARGTDGQLYHSNYSYMADWPPLTVAAAGPITGEPSAVMNPTTGPEVFARDTSGYVVRSAWNGTSYSTFARVGARVVASDPFGWTRSDGTTDIFAIDASGALVTTHSTGSNWSTWTSLGSGFDPCVETTPAVDGGMPDAGHDAGPPDAGHDAGPSDAGHDAGMPDAGYDAGTPDAGYDAGSPDAGTLPGIDAGPDETDAGVIPPTDAGARVDAGGFSLPHDVHTVPSGGCHCSTGFASADSVAWLALGASLLRRRKSRGFSV